MARGRPRKQVVLDESNAASHLQVKAYLPLTQWDQEGVAKRVDAFWRASEGELLHRKALAHLVASYAEEGARILDVGCGTGLLYPALAKRVSKLTYVGLDYSPAMLEIAKSNYPDVDFRGGNAETLDYPDNWFDVACAFEVFGYLNPIDQAVSELIRVSKKAAIFTVWLTAWSRPVNGQDHWEHTDITVHAAIDKALAAQGIKAVVTSAGVGPVVAYIVEKV